MHGLHGLLRAGQLILAAAFVLGSAALVGVGLVVIHHLIPTQEEDAAIDAVLELLPRVECAQCGYPGCRPYAAAIVNHGAALNRCPPGGEATVQRLAKLLSRQTDEVDRTLGRATMDQVAEINPAECIGCYRCVEACPVDAIVGAPQHLHQVLTRECTGCELCLQPCPVDCISLVART